MHAGIDCHRQPLPEGLRTKDIEHGVCERLEGPAVGCTLPAWRECPRELFRVDRWIDDELVSAALRLYGDVIGWRTSPGTFQSPPGIAILAQAHYSELVSGLSANERTRLLWAVRVFHRANMDMQGGATGGD